MALLCAMLTACADDSTDRQFAGDEQSTAGPTVTFPPIPTLEPGASPEPRASPLAEDDLFSIRGVGTFGATVLDDVVYLLPSSLDLPRAVAIDAMWKPWLADVSPDGEYVAVLASLASSAKTWRVLVVDASGAIVSEHSITGDDATASVPADVVTTGSGGLDWAPDSSRLAVALPTGGIYMVDLTDDRVLEMSPPRRVPRPGFLSWSHNGQAIAYTAQPDARSGFGIYVAPVAALPLDPITVLRPDSTGNRSARQITWSGSDNTIVFILERRETGGAGGDVLSVSATGGVSEVIWSTGMRFGDIGAIDIELSPDGQVLAILTLSETGPFVQLQQMGGTAHTERFVDMPLVSGSIAWTEDGLLVVAGSLATEMDPAEPLAALVDAQGVVTVPAPPATPVASPQPVGSPVPASPVASPVPASPAPATPVASPAA
jgi:hypothetical protein